MKVRKEDIFFNEFDSMVKISCLIRKSNRASRINLRILSRDSAVLTLPRWATLNSGYAFLEKQKKWLTQAIRKFPVPCTLEEYFSKNGKIWLGENHHELIWSITSGKPRAYHEIFDDRIYLYLPNDIKIEESLFLFLRKLSKENLTDRLNFLSSKTGLKSNKIRIGNQKTRWGSCSSKGTISLNWRLVLLPYQIGNYVILHELAHLRYLNHSTEFWEYLNEICLNAKLLDVQLRKVGKAIIGLGHHY